MRVHPRARASRGVLNRLGCPTPEQADRRSDKPTPAQAPRLQKEPYDDGNISLLFLWFPHISSSLSMHCMLYIQVT